MISNTLKSINSKIASLEKKAEAERKKLLSGLHEKVGYESTAALIEALQSLGSSKPASRRGPKPASRRGRKPGRKAKKAATKSVRAKKTGAKKRAKRTRITADMKKKIVAALKAGGKGTQVAKDFGISIPSLHNIKKAAGLTKARKK